MSDTSTPVCSGVARHRFLGNSAVVSDSLVVGFHVPSASQSLAWGAAPAATIPAEVNAWVVIKPDDTVVIRIARSAMGQGTLYGLAQFVAEEFDCDWAEVTTEYPTPGQNLARNCVWGIFSRGGSRGIRESSDDVRKGGTTARMMLVQAAANDLKMPAPPNAAPSPARSRKSRAAAARPRAKWRPLRAGSCRRPRSR